MSPLDRAPSALSELSAFFKPRSTPCIPFIYRCLRITKTEF